VGHIHRGAHWPVSARVTWTGAQRPKADVASGYFPVGPVSDGTRPTSNAPMTLTHYADMWSPSDTVPTF
jgi:hypothetical protein